MRKREVFVALEVQQYNLLARDTYVDMRGKEIGSTHQDFRNPSGARVAFVQNLFPLRMPFDERSNAPSTCPLPIQLYPRASMLPACAGD